MTIHTTHPFADPDPDPARRFRGRLAGAVSLWTAGEGVTRAGLTVTSAMVALAEEPRILVLLDPDSDLRAELSATGQGVVQLLRWSDRQLAEAFAGTAPAPGGPFRQSQFTATRYGPRLAAAATWAEVTVVDEREVGWSVEVGCRLDHVEIGDDDEPLLHRRGRYFTV